MSRSNPFSKREPAKKRLINVSVTQEQFEAFEEMKKFYGIETSGEMIKKALEAQYQRMKPVRGSGE